MGEAGDEVEQRDNRWSRTLKGRDEFPGSNGQGCGLSVKLIWV